MVDKELIDKVSNLKIKVENQAAYVRQLKGQGKHKSEIQPSIDELIKLKKELADLNSKLPESNGKYGDSDLKYFDRTAFEEMCKKKFFFSMSFGPYGGVSGLFDYGPPGCALQANIIDIWRKHFVLEEDMLELDCSILTPHDVLLTSGHVDRFADLMAKDTKTGDIFRVDHLIEQSLEKMIENTKNPPESFKKSKVPIQILSDDQINEAERILAQIDGLTVQELIEIIQKFNIKSPLGNPLSDPEVFNLMFGTPIGPTGTLKGYLRPETAQGQFLNFKKLLEFNNARMPFASASIGKSFRNEISPRSGLLRVREFMMAEIEHFVNPDIKDHPRFSEVQNYSLNLLPSHVQLSGKTQCIKMETGKAVSEGIINNQTLGYFVARISQFLHRIGLDMDRVRFRQHLKNEMAHYACDCWDAEILTSYGWIECVGCADRSAFDLTKHSEKTKEKLVAREVLEKPVTVTKLVYQINKKKFGPVFKKEGPVAEKFLQSMSEEMLLEIKTQLEENGKAILTFVNHSGEKVSREITSDLLKIEKVTEVKHVNEYVPNVIEPSFGIGRILYSLLEHSWYIREGSNQSDPRNVLRFPAEVAPVKCLLVPLSNNDVFINMIQDIRKKLRASGISHRVDDSSGSIGRRYARNDELGTAFGITVDFQSISDGTVTLRERDSMQQIREKVEIIMEVIARLCSRLISWEYVTQKYKIFTKQETDDE